jgi:hypothetical protein
MQIVSEFRMQYWLSFLKNSYLQVHLHVGTNEPMNVTFIIAPSFSLLKIDVPFVFIGDDASPGLLVPNLFTSLLTSFEIEVNLKSHRIA